MERKTIARWLIVAALACLGLFLVVGAASAQEGQTTVQGSQTSTDSEAETGEATGENTASFGAGPTAEGGDHASAQQLGTNRASVSQSGSAKSGDPVAGAQITGAVASNVRVQNQNFADGASATSGDVDFTNELEVAIGPSATADDTTQVSQFGSNHLDLAQDTAAITGDAVAGAQVTGIVGDGEHVVQNQNAGLDNEAESGEATLENATELSVGPFAESDDVAQTGQVGDNDAVLSQSSEARSGDAVVQSQVTGIVGGSATVQNSGFSEGGETESGAATATNAIEALGVAIVAPSAAADVAQASQTGDNSADTTQDLSASSGDSVSGSQVTGGVGDEGGFFTVQNQQASEDDESISGDVSLGNDLENLVGPTVEGDDVANASQTGDNSVTTAQTTAGESGDALAGAQVTGAVGHEDVTVQNSNFADGPSSESGTVEAGGDGDGLNNVTTVVGPTAEGDVASASQFGDNSASLDQAGTATTGDAVSGGQVTGIVASGSTVIVQNQNASVDAEATTGELDLDSVNTVEESGVGPGAEGDDVAQTSQTGDNSFALGQEAVLATGDAVGGSQVTGIVDEGGADVTVMNSNTSEGSVSESGELTSDAVNLVEALVGAGATDGDASQASQSGDNALSVDQAVSVGSGDAVAGAQISGVVSGDGSDVTVMNQNNSDDDEATTGEIDASEANNVSLATGPFADGGDSSSVSQFGDNSLTAAQAVEAASGDAVAGGQVSGIVSGDHTTARVANSNFSTDAAPESGSVTFDTANLFEPLGNTIGPDAGEDADVAQAQQTGDNSADVSQAADVSSGDAVGAAQVTGVVAGHESDVTVMNQTACVDCSEVVTGDVDLGDGNSVEIAAVGPAAEGDDFAGAQQNGDNSAAIDQSIMAHSGDAVAGAQVTGVVAGDGSEVTASLMNTSEEAEAESGAVDGATNTFEVESIGPSAIADAAQASQFGDDSLDFSQAVDAGSGDAVAGSQVTGVVGPTDATVQASNHDDASASTTGDVDASNDATGNLTPSAEGDTVANVSHSGDSDLASDQALNTETGDAVAGSQIGGDVGSSGTTSFSTSGTLGDLTSVGVASAA